jgi:hypothetical protein
VIGLTRTPCEEAEYSVELLVVDSYVRLDHDGSRMAKAT